MKKQTSVELKKLNIHPIAPFPFHPGSFYRPVIISLYIVNPHFFSCREASRGYFGDLTRPVQTHTPQLGTLHVVNIGFYLCGDVISGLPLSSSVGVLPSVQRTLYWPEVLPWLLLHLIFGRFFFVGVRSSTSALRLLSVITRRHA